MININSLAKSFADDLLFYDASFTIAPGEKIGLVGRNGSGKSTLFKLLLEEELPDEGSIQIPTQYKVTSLKQHLSFSKGDVVSEVMTGLPEEKMYETYIAEKILSGLGFSDDDFSKSPDSFSGGFQVRIQLAKSLIQEPDLLLLDEPTNYLDILSMRWLEKYLKNYNKEFVIITHDRDFMNAVTNSIMGIHRHKIKKIKGGTSKYFAQIAEEEQIHEKTRLNDERKRKDLETFINKFRAKARQASLAQSRMKMLEKMEQKDKLHAEQNLDFSFTYKDIPSRNLLACDSLSFGYKENELLFQNLTVQIKKGDRIAIIGKNGKGKSTLLNILAGELPGHGGEINKHPDVALGFFGQTNINRLDLESTVEDEIQRSNEALTFTRVRGICGLMMFSQDMALKKIKVLSGGERSRVLLGKILANPSNLLLLDEPTNHLDQESVVALLDEIRHFEGAVLLVTHSEYVLRKFAKKLVVFTNDEAFIFDGPYDEFLKTTGFFEEEKSGKEENIKSNQKDTYQLSKEEKRKKKKREREIAKHEAEIERLELEKEKILKQLEEASNQSHVEDIKNSSKQLHEIEEKIESLFLKLEKLENSFL